MEDSIINIIQTIGLPVALIVYYLFFERPRQVQRDDRLTERYDALIDRIMLGQKECAEKMETALEKHNEYIKRLITIFDKKS